MTKYTKKSFTAVIIVSLLMTILSSTIFFNSLLHAPAGTVYLGAIHYWEDYFFYLNHFFQGAHGAWLIANRFTSELTNPTIIYWPNLLLGKVGGWIGIAPIFSYNFSVLLLTYIALLLSFEFFRRAYPTNSKLAVGGFLFANLATSLMNRIQTPGGILWWPFQIWRTPDFAFDRLGGAPHQLLGTILFYLLCILLWYPKSHKSVRRDIIFVILTGALASLQPIQALLLLATSWVVGAGKYQTRSLLLSTIVCGATVIWLNTYYSQEPFAQAKAWEATAQSLTVLPFLLESIGPIFLLACIGVFTRIRILTKPEKFGILFILISYGLFMSPIPAKYGIANVRVIFPGTYIFWGLLAVYGWQASAAWLAKKLKLHFRITAAAILSLFILISLPTLVWEVLQKSQVEPNQFPPIYLPQPIYQGFTFLSHRLPYDDVVLASPTTHMASLVPAMSGHTTFSGHGLMTIHNDIKVQESNNFFSLTMAPDEAKNWLATKNIKYVLLTSYDTSPSLISGHYPFLHEIFANSNVEIYKTP